MAVFYTFVYTVCIKMYCIFILQEYILLKLNNHFVHMKFKINVAKEKIFPIKMI